ncbi:chloride channel protein [Kangiella sp. HZ709]|uniref:chloride channel protein n=1 Tax=Kangiella sp. HZ709 TaxID=2666328 RepID=UPI0012AEEC92|nr:chloride channel protein [Kangiella sp. HZ709]MRX27656.1 chloride channel protein [Kangiella sp. HZ709]
MTLIDRLRLKLGGFDALALMAVIGLICGILAGGSNILFRLFTESSIVLWAPDNLRTDETERDFEDMSWMFRLALTTFGGLLVGLILQKLAPQTRQVGVSHVLERLNYHQGNLPVKNAIAQFFIGGMTIASGQSVGREGPGIHLGSTSGSWLGRKLKLPNNSTRILVGCGCAAAISASFNTPLAGVIFAMEIIVMEYAVASFIPIILSSVAGAILTQWVFGPDPAFDVPSHLDIQSLWEMPYFLLVGILGGTLASAFIFLTRRVARLSRKWHVWVKTTVAGASVGIIAIGIPEVMGIGYDTVNGAIHDELLLKVLILALAGKFVATIICSGLSLPGGVIGPTLFMGAMLGGVMGNIGGSFFPEHSSFEGFYAIIGMCTLMSAVLQAPLAALIALLELTNNPNIILPGMFSIVVANLVVTQVFKQRAFWETQMGDRGLEIKVNPIKQVLRSIGVAGVMERNMVVSKRLNTHLELEILLKDNPRWVLIKEEEQIISLMVASDLARYLIEIEKQINANEQVETESEPSNAQEHDTSLQEKAGDALIDLMQIPANRQDLLSINLQATLEETFDKMEQRKITAAYVYRLTADEQERIYGVITREMITDQYIFAKKDTGRLETA